MPRFWVPVNPTWSSKSNLRSLRLWLGWIMNAKEWILPSKVILFFAFKNFDGSTPDTFLCRFQQKKTVRVPPSTVVSFWSCHLVNEKKKKQKNLILGTQVRGIGPNIRRFLKHATFNWCSSLCGNNNFLYHYFCLSSGRYKFHSTSYENKSQTKILLKIEKFEKIDHG